MDFPGHSQPMPPRTTHQRMTSAGTRLPSAKQGRQVIERNTVADLLFALRETGPCFGKQPIFGEN